MSAIVVLGSANLDFVVRSPRFPEPGETILGHSFTTVPGGKGLNQAIAAARAGGDVAFLGAVGRDAFGHQLSEALQQNGVQVDGLVQVDGATGTAHVCVLDDGENSIVVVPGANAADDLGAHAHAQIRGASYLVAQLERPVSLVTQAFRLARDAGVRTVLTPAPADHLEAALLRLTDILVPNSGEARALARVDDDREAAVCLSRAARVVVMTRGSQGALVARDGEIAAEIPARRVVPVDTTGAGDTFVGVLVARLSLGEPLDSALGAASVAASIAVTRPGASNAMPMWDEVAALV